MVEGLGLYQLVMSDIVDMSSRAPYSQASLLFHTGCAEVSVPQLQVRAGGLADALVAPRQGLGFRV